MIISKKTFLIQFNIIGFDGEFHEGDLFNAIKSKRAAIKGVEFNYFYLSWCPHSRFWPVFICKSNPTCCVTQKRDS